MGLAAGSRAEGANVGNMAIRDPGPPMGRRMPPASPLQAWSAYDACKYASAQRALIWSAAALGVSSAVLVAAVALSMFVLPGGAGFVLVPLVLVGVIVCPAAAFTFVCFALYVRHLRDR